MNSFKSSESKVEWPLDESAEALSDRLIWCLAVRSRLDIELDEFLGLLKDHGICKVMINDPAGQEFEFSFQMPNREFAETAFSF